MESAFSVKVGEFEGPLDLLLSLIEERKMLVSDVSLSRVADDFLSYLETHIAFPVGQAAHFVVVAATLLLLKSRSLLPVLSLTEEEEDDVKDLEFRLSLYQVIRNAARAMGTLAGRMFFGPGAPVADPVFVAPKDLSLASLQEAAGRVIQNAPQNPIAREEASVEAVISLEDMMNSLADRIGEAIRMTFRDFVGSAKDRRELVVGFLAVLELVKRGLLLVEQPALFGEITMQYNGTPQAPRFE